MATVDDIKLYVVRNERSSRNQGDSSEMEVSANSSTGTGKTTVKAEEHASPGSIGAKAKSERSVYQSLWGIDWSALHGSGISR